MDRSLPGSSVCRIFQARMLQWVAIPFSRGSSQPRDRTQVSHVVGRCFSVWAAREVLWSLSWVQVCHISHSIWSNFDCFPKSKSGTAPCCALVPMLGGWLVPPVCPPLKLPEVSLLSRLCYAQGLPNCDNSQQLPFMESLSCSRNWAE